MRSFFGVYFYLLFILFFIYFLFIYLFLFIFYLFIYLFYFWSLFLFPLRSTLHEESKPCHVQGCA